MSQQQAVQPIVVKQDNGEMVLKLVLENPKQETQTLILQQPDDKEFTMSTDTTAIAAFDYATGIAVFLALCATGLAYWFGVRSFHLTKQSFDIVIKQIESSAKIVSSSNRENLNAQNELKIKELKMIYRAQELAELRKGIQSYVSGGIRVRYFYSQSHAYNENNIFLKEDSSIFKQELRLAKIEFQVATYSLFTYLDHFNELHQNIHLKMLDILSIVDLMVEKEQDKNVYDVNTKKFISQFQNLQAILKTLLQHESFNNKGE